MKIVCMSDTHGDHRRIQVPDGDVLVHAGDFTCFGKKEHAQDFNEWLGTLPHKHKLVVEGNHENNAPWRKDIQSILTNATFLHQTGVEIDGISFFGVGFSWSHRDPAGHPNHHQIPQNTHVVIAHNPALGMVDGHVGCLSLKTHMMKLKPRCVISGHIHREYGAVLTTKPWWFGMVASPPCTLDVTKPILLTQKEEIVFVNCALCNDRVVTKPPVMVVLDL
eukprot:c788_g1_i1.p1 GENE.c788_g1_i1~~c788_g1_i1.p1  ORF type:complete len:221 (+),score=46.68 c788_g1_i1:80-742(+)